MTSAQGTKHRVQLDFSSQALDQIDQMQKAMGATSRAEVIRAALGTLQWAINHVQQQNSIIVERPDGERIQVEFPFLSGVPQVLRSGR